MREPVHVIGIDLGGTAIRAGVGDRNGRILRRLERPTPLSSTADLLDALDEVVEALLAFGGISALGLGVPGTIDYRLGRVVSAANLPLQGAELREHVHARFGLPVQIENDANAATIAEWVLGAGRGTRHMVMLTLGTGIGGGLILDGRPYRGATGAAGELGHVVIEHDGPACQGFCTGRGHLEAVASGTAADRSAREVLGGHADASELVREARAGRREARAALDEIGRKLGSAIGSLVNVLDPELVVVGGGFAAAGDLILEPARLVVEREALEPARGVVRIVPAELGGDAGLAGAVLVGFEALAA